MKISDEKKGKTTYLEFLLTERYTKLKRDKREKREREDSEPKERLEKRGKQGR